MILIYSEEITPRVKYIFHLIFTQILQVECTFTTNSYDFQKSEIPKINYSAEKFGNELYIKPHRLLFLKAIITPTINSVWHNAQKYFFESSKDSVLPFDPFAASFYLVTRYEEYLEPELDNFGRYMAKNSILSNYNLLKKPVVNIWANLLTEIILAKYPKFIFPKKKFKFISSIDIDNAWAFLHKGFLRTSAALGKSILTGNVSEFKQRVTVLTGNEEDPYNSYPYLKSVFNGNEDKVKFFFLIGDYAQYDKNITHKNKNYKKLIADISDKFDIGIHPSFASGKKRGLKKIMEEKQRLQGISGKEIQKSRQHFLKITFPKTYRRLIKSGISEDFSLGYSSETGFRAGICTPFYFYDLKKEKTTKLLVTPFQVMDVTLRDYLGLTPAEALSEITNLMTEVKNVGGTFVSIWHNETVTDLGRWKGFREVFEEMNKTGFDWVNE